MYAEDMIKMAAELVKRREAQDKESYLVRNSTVVVANFNSDQESDLDHKRRYQKRDVASEDELEAYIFSDEPTIRYDRVDDHETIANVIEKETVLMEWKGMARKDKCLRECREMFTSGERRCRLLVTRKVTTKEYSCTFYDIADDKVNTVAKVVERGRQQRPFSGGSGGQRFEIQSYPYQVPTRHSEAREYFNVLTTDVVSDAKTLRPFHYIDNVVHINDCLYFCLKLWIEPEKNKFGDNKCQQVEAVRSAARQQGHSIRVSIDDVDVDVD